MNFVCLVGRLAEASPLAVPMEGGRSSFLLEVPRRGADGIEEPGVVDVPIVLPPALASTSGDRLEPGRVVAVVGLLEVDVDYSGTSPRTCPLIIAERIEALA